MEDARFLHRQANRCYQLAWQSFDLRVAQKLNLLGNEHTVKARKLRSQSNGTPDEPRTGRWRRAKSRGQPSRDAEDRDKLQTSTDSTKHTDTA